MSVNGMSEKKAVFPEQEFINELAKKYFEAKNSSNKGQMKANKDAILIQILYNQNNIKKYFESYCMKKLSGYDREVLNIATNDDVQGLMVDFFIDSDFLNNYDYTENPNFTAVFIMSFRHYISNKLRKYKTVKGADTDSVTGKKIPQPIIYRENTIVKDDEGNESDTICNIPSDENIEESFAENERKNEIRIKLISLCTCFFISKKGKSANKTRYEYYRIFTTNIIVCDIRDTSDCNIYNRQEVMQVIDGDYIRFMAFTDFKNPEDILTMKMKKYSDIFENGSNGLLKFDNEAKVIIEYRFQSGLDSKRVSASAVSQQLDRFREDCEIIKKEASYEL